MTKHLFIFLFILSFSGTKAQLFPHYNAYQRRYPLANYLTQHGFLNTLYAAPEDANELRQGSTIYRNYLPRFLTNTALAGTTVNVSVVEMKNNYSFFWNYFYNTPEINGKQLDSLFARETVIENLQLRFNKNGQLSFRSRLLNQYKGYLEADSLWLNYGNSNGSPTINVETKNYAKHQNGGYASIYAGTFKSGPVVRESSSQTIYTFNEAGLLSGKYYTHQQYANKKKDYKPGTMRTAYSYDEKGRLLCRRDSFPEQDSSSTHLFSYKELTFDFKTLQQEYEILKTPSVRNWITKSFVADSLSLLDFSGGYSTNESGLYIMQNHSMPVLKLEKLNSFNAYMSTEAFETWNDSMGTTRLHYYITRVPPPEDSVARYIPGYTSGCMIYQSYTRPGGLVSVQSVRVNNQQELRFKNGWRVFLCRANDPGVHELIPGSHSFFGFDHSDTEAIFINPAGQIKYYYENKRLYKLEY